MNIPDYVRIGGVNYEIREVENFNDGVKVCYGLIDFDDSIIYLNSSNQGYQHKVQVLLHEILHGIQYHANLEIENEEIVIEILSKGLYQVLGDNPQLLEEPSGTEVEDDEEK